MNIRKLISSDKPWVETIVTTHFGSPRVVSRGVLHDVRLLPGFVAEEDSKPSGLLQNRFDGDQCEIVILISIIQRHGISRQLIEVLKAITRHSGCNRLWLITTNNDRGANEFYGGLGLKQIAIHRGAVREARKLKPEIPEFDRKGLPIEDEIEFEQRL